MKRKVINGNCPRDRIVLLMGVLFALSGCTFLGPTNPDLKIIYDEAAQYHKPDRNPVIVIPGILGSKLVDDETGQVVWGAFDPKSANPNRPEGARLISLPIEGDRSLSEIRDRVRASGVLDKVSISLLGIPLDIRAYAGILSTLGAGGYRDDAFGLGAIDYGDDHFTCFQFSYDWRRDNVENAKRLKAFMDEKRAYIQAEYKERYGIENADVKFDVVAHSMGGLLLRYFLRYGDQDLTEIGDNGPSWSGGDYVDRAILVATPSAGSVLAMRQLIKGYEVGKPILPKYPASVLGTFPSIYQLLPRPRHGSYVLDGKSENLLGDIYDPALWQRYEWGLAANDKETRTMLEVLLPNEPDAEKRHLLAVAMQGRMLARARAFHEAIDRPAIPPDGIELFLVAGDSEKTPKEISVNSHSGEISISEHAPGDGTVLRTSALLDERVGHEWMPTLNSPIAWDKTLFLSAKHIRLTDDPAFANNVLYWLLEEPRATKHNELLAQ